MGHGAEPALGSVPRDYLQAYNRRPVRHAVRASPPRGHTGIALCGEAVTPTTWPWEGDDGRDGRRCMSCTAAVALQRGWASPPPDDDPEDEAKTALGRVMQYAQRCGWVVTDERPAKMVLRWEGVTIYVLLAKRGGVRHLEMLQDGTPVRTLNNTAGGKIERLVEWVAEMSDPHGHVSLPRHVKKHY
jgi:hypothetical protein